MSSGDLGAYRAQHDSIREEYRKQAATWAKNEVSPELRWAAELLGLQTHFAALDVAAGTGLLARAISPHVDRVVAVDITPEMLAGGRAATGREGISNITFEQGAAEALPYPAASFDAVVTRFSVHHFQDPGAVLAEMSRVCRPRGKVLIIDLTSPEEEEVAARYNELERLRDHTHTRALTPGDLKKLVWEAGIEVTGYHTRQVEMDLHHWLDASDTGLEERRRIKEAMDQDMRGSVRTGFQPFVRDSRIMFLHTWGVVVGVKP